MMARERLPNRRGHEGLFFSHGGFDYTAGIGRFDDGRLAEIFLTGSKSGTTIDAWAHDAAIVASLALQHGVAPETIRHAIGREHGGGAATPLGALLDLLADEAP
jgi:ribonucleoside-diphosphate reductase alpha chain